MHTIKGMGATMGYAIVAELAHELETVLDRVRRGDLAIDADVMDVLFRSADVLEQAVEAAVAGRDGEVLAADLVATLHALGLGERATQRGGWTVAAPTGAGTLIRIRLSPDTPLRGVRAFIIVQSLAKLGDVTATEPSLDDLQAEGFESDFALRLETTDASRGRRARSFDAPATSPTCRSATTERRRPRRSAAVVVEPIASTVDTGIAARDTCASTCAGSTR